jgi:hypothetical protein
MVTGSSFAFLGGPIAGRFTSQFSGFAKFATSLTVDAFEGLLTSVSTGATTSYLAGTQYDTFAKDAYQGAGAGIAAFMYGNMFKQLGAGTIGGDLLPTETTGRVLKDFVTPAAATGLVNSIMIDFENREVD